jgi:hypothetical protein
MYKDCSKVRQLLRNFNVTEYSYYTYYYSASVSQPLSHGTRLNDPSAPARLAKRKRSERLLLRMDTWLGCFACDTKR